MIYWRQNEKKLGYVQNDIVLQQIFFFINFRRKVMTEQENWL